MKATTIILADDHPFVRQGLRATLAREPGLQLLAETGDGLDAVRLVEQWQPQVLIVDLMMPGLNGLEVTRQVRQLRHCPPTQVIVLSMQADEQYVIEALHNGARGYVLKDAPAEELIAAIQQVIHGQLYLSQHFADRAFALFQQARTPANSDPFASLSSREREVLQLTAEGLSSTQIAERLFISARTVETHRVNLMRKLGLHNQAEIIRYAVRRGVVE
jgi:DNA-binding NarL/FixJ family response regulator